MCIYKTIYQSHRFFSLWACQHREKLCLPSSLSRLFCRIVQASPALSRQIIADGNEPNNVWSDENGNGNNTQLSGRGWGGRNFPFLSLSFAALLRCRAIWTGCFLCVQLFHYSVDDDDNDDKTTMHAMAAAKPTRNKKKCKETTTMTTTLTFILEHNCCLFSFRFPSFLIRTTGEGGRGSGEKIICKIRQTTTLGVHVHTPFELRANTMYVHTRTTVESEKIWCGAVLSTLSL